MAGLDIINTLRQWREQGSKSNRRLAEVVLDDIDFASRASIADLAERAGVSEPTVTRFCRTLGYEGVRDLKRTLAQILALGGPYLYPEPLDRSERDARIVAAIADGVERSIALVQDTVDMKEVDVIVPRIAAAREVVVFGSGGVSSLGAVELQNRLFRLGVPVVSYTDGQLQRMAAAVCRDDTVAVAISVSGEAASLVESLSVARQYGALTVAITPPGSRLANHAHTVLPFLVPPDNQLYKPTSARYALLFIIDMVATATAEHIGPEVLETLRRVRIALTGLNTSDPTRPIGD